ncbi:hypothetical protein LUZ60_002777 [Juncus effusus]|nr:hypothetical protein LUZ60_002777 [Juncus effusus]
MATLPSNQIYTPSFTGFATSPHFTMACLTTPSPRPNGVYLELMENVANNVSDQNNSSGMYLEKPYEKFVSVYVADLSDAVKDVDLFEFFQGAGTSIVTVKVCRDANMGNSLGYGYANFLYHEDATLAIEKLNNTILCGRQIRLMLSTRKSEELGNGNVHVKNLSLSADDTRLYEIFEKIGSILRVKVKRNDDGSSRGYGFVQFTTKELADAAITSIDGTIVDGKELIVSHYVKKSERKVNDPDCFNNVYVKNIDEEFDETLIRLKFSKFGHITSIKIEKDENGNPRGFCFVCFENPDDAKMAVQVMNGLNLGNKILYVGRAMKKAERVQFLQAQREKMAKERQIETLGPNLFVKNLSEKVDDAILHEYFKQCGLITSAKVMRNDSGDSKGFGFVCYSSPEEAQKAIATLNHQLFYGKPLYVGST